MKTIAAILAHAAPLEPGFHIKIENSPYMALVIEDIQELGHTVSLLSPWPITESKTATSCATRKCCLRFQRMGSRPFLLRTTGAMTM